MRPDKVGLRSQVAPPRICDTPAIQHRDDHLAHQCRGNTARKASSATMQTKMIRVRKPNARPGFAAGGRHGVESGRETISGSVCRDVDRHRQDRRHVAFRCRRQTGQAEKTKTVARMNGVLRISST